MESFNHLDLSFAEAFFQEKESEFKFVSAYNFDESMKRLEELNYQNYEHLFFSSNMEKKLEFDKFELSESNLVINKVKFLSRQAGEDFNNLFEIVNLENYIDPNLPKDIKIQKNLQNESMSLVFYPDFEMIVKNIDENFLQQSFFKNQELFPSKNKLVQFNENQELKMEIEITQQSIKGYYLREDFNKSGQLEVLIYLDRAPKFKSNFLNYNERKFEYTINPFMNFQDPFSNLIYKTSTLWISTDIYNGKKIKNSETFSEFFKSLNMKNLLDIDELTISPRPKEEISEYFENKELKKYFGQELYHFFYMNLAMISQGIISYLNSIKFLRSLITIIKNNTIIPKDGLLFNEIIESIINDYLNRGELDEKDLDEYIKNYSSKLDNNKIPKKKVDKNQFEPIKIQRIIVTPSMILFYPYQMDQGNRVIREYIDDPTMGMRLAFKFDDMSEGRWSNCLLTEYSKFFLHNGLKLIDRHFMFFCYSQSQFRSFSCWLIQNREEVLKKCGDFSSIKLVSKYGARIGQCLTSTTKTLKMNEYNIVTIDDLEIDNIVYSDGVSMMDINIAIKIKEKLMIDELPSAFQGRFLGCKGVWVVYNDESKCAKDTIYIRKSQRKFIKHYDGEDIYFEVCSVAKFNRAFLNRQVILLLSARGIENNVFLDKFDEFIKLCLDLRNVLALINYETCRKTLLSMYESGITHKNDRLICSVINSNQSFIYKELKDRARIYVENGACLMGIVDEYGILEYNEVFCQIVKSEDSDPIILNRDYVVTKCPCLHPGDIRVLNFKKYEPNEPETLKYRKLEQFKNVIIFPQKGKKPIPSEISGGDLDGDMYFVFYDEKLNDKIKNKNYEPMNYSFETKVKELENISFDDIICFFAEYVNFNNLGMIANAHLAISVSMGNEGGAEHEKAKKLAEKFARAVDAPKSGEKIELDDNERVDCYPQFMKDKKKGRKKRYNHILQTLFDKSKMEEEKTNEKITISEFVDSTFNLRNVNFEDFLVESVYFYYKYFKSISEILRINDIKKESELMTGNNDEYSDFQKKKHNYDIKELIEKNLNSIFEQVSNNFRKTIISDQSKFNLETYSLIYIKNASLERALCNYHLTYDIGKYISKFNEIDEYIKKFLGRIKKPIKLDNLNYLCIKRGYDDSLFEEINLINNYGKYEKENTEENFSSLKKMVAEAIDYFKKIKNELPSKCDEENQRRILFYPWCVSSNVLIGIKRTSKFNI